MKAKAAGWLIGAIFIFIGVLFLVIGIFIASSNIAFKNRAIEQTAYISDIRKEYDGTLSESRRHRSYKAYVKYYVDDKEYEERLDYYSGGMRVGDKVKIYYDPDHPDQILSKFGFNFLFIIPLIGLIFFAVGSVVILMKVRKIMINKSLKEKGEAVYAEISEVTLNRSYKVNGRSPYIITCKWTDPSTGLIYFFKSPNIWFNPEPIINDRQIQSLVVYIERDNPKRYFVSVEEIEKMVALA